MISQDCSFTTGGNLTALKMNINSVSFIRSQNNEPHIKRVSPNFQIFYVTVGMGELHKDGRIFNISQGQGFMISPHEIVAYKGHSDNPWEYYCFSFSGQNAQRYLEERGIYSAAPVFFSHNPQLSEKYAKSLLSIAQKNPESDDLLLGCFLMFASTIRSETANAVESSHVLYTEKACKYISDNFSLNITIEDIAAHVNVDRSYLYKLFKKRFNLSIQEYMQKVRLQNAEFLLRTTSRALGEISSVCGFNNYSHFSKTFYRHFGKSPRDYRLGFD